MASAAGREIDLGRWVMGHEFVEEYLSAVDDSSSIYGDLGVVPPTALAARALAELLKELSLPPGAIHAAQELKCGRMVRWGEEVYCVAKLSRPVRRGEWRFISADFTLYGEDGEALVRGKSTVLAPVNEVGGE